MRAPMARAVIGGLITSTLLTLLVVPVVYTLLDDFAGWVHRKWAGIPQEKDAMIVNIRMACKRQSQRVNESTSERRKEAEPLGKRAFGEPFSSLALSLVGSLALSSRWHSPSW